MHLPARPAVLKYAGRSAITAIAFVGLIVSAFGQSDQSNARTTPIIEFPNLGPIPGSMEPATGLAPGTLESGMEGAGPGLIGGQRRSGRIPKVSRGHKGAVVARAGAMQLPESLPMPVVARSRIVPTTAIDKTIIYDEGPPVGLTLDELIDRVVQFNLDIRALRQEIPQADADILTAGLRTNPYIYIDSQFIPYGAFTDATPGGPTQYDVNITYPLDVSRKRQNRVAIARLARSTLEAQFQDVVRRQIDNAYDAFVAIQAARVDMLVAQAAVRRQEALLAAARLKAKPTERDELTELLAYHLESSRVAFGDAAEAFADAQENVALMMDMPPEQAVGIYPRGSLRDAFPPPPSVDELTAIALRCRPDVFAARRGVSRANAEVDLQRAQRFEDVFLFYDPITIQDNRPVNAPNSKSWAIGITFSMPIHNRNQGNIARARSNVGQTRLELASLERRVGTEVRMADREYQASLAALNRIEGELLPRAEARLARHVEEFEKGELEADELEEHFQDAAELAQSHREAAVRHRRSMLDLNTAIGLRLLP
jgi:cobalt-zinc-cadmium efflux system outer membrane protein